VQPAADDAEYRGNFYRLPFICVVGLRFVLGGEEAFDGVWAYHLGDTLPKQWRCRQGSRRRMTLHVPATHQSLVCKDFYLVSAVSAWTLTTPGLPGT
jgi:hypothetical protein